MRSEIKVSDEAASLISELHGTVIECDGWLYAKWQLRKYINRLESAERERDELRAALAWRPIESMPRNCRVLVWHKELGTETKFYGPETEMAAGQYWLPLPPPPGQDATAPTDQTPPPSPAPELIDPDDEDDDEWDSEGFAEALDQAFESEWEADRG